MGGISMKQDEVTGLTPEQVFELYEAMFKEPLAAPLDYGQVWIDTDQLLEIGRQALVSGTAPDWKTICGGDLPEGADT